jgi:4'-phosphopantetheinyl transferase
MKIYAIKIKEISKENLQEISEFIRREKKIKIQKLNHEKDKIRTLIGEVLIRNIIKENLAIRNSNINFEINRYGKPFLKDNPNFNFNISHAEDYVVCAIDHKPIGIDIEKIRPIEYKSIANNFFTSKELNFIMEENLNNQLNKFYEIWTLKESYAKACGQGLYMSLKAFSMDYENNGGIKVVIDNKYDECRIKSFDLESSYKMAVCAFSKIITKDITIINQETLISNFLYT